MTGNAGEGCAEIEATYLGFQHGLKQDLHLRFLASLKYFFSLHNWPVTLMMIVELLQIYTNVTDSRFLALSLYEKACHKFRIQSVLCSFSFFSERKQVLFSFQIKSFL